MHKGIIHIYWSNITKFIASLKRINHIKLESLETLGIFLDKIKIVPCLGIKPPPLVLKA